MTKDEAVEAANLLEDEGWWIRSIEHIWAEFEDLWIVYAWRIHKEPNSSTYRWGNDIPLPYRKSFSDLEQTKEYLAKKRVSGYTP